MTQQNVENEINLPENECADSLRYCFLPGSIRLCLGSCMAYIGEGKTHCRILNALEKLVPQPTRSIPQPQLTIPRTIR